jgi:hypothetical protein
MQGPENPTSSGVRQQHGRRDNSDGRVVAVLLIQVRREGDAGRKRSDYVGDHAACYAPEDKLQMARLAERDRRIERERRIKADEEQERERHEVRLLALPTCQESWHPVYTAVAALVITALQGRGPLVNNEGPPRGLSVKNRHAIAIFNRSLFL